MIAFGPMHDALLSVFGQPVTVAGQELTGVVTHDAEVQFESGLIDRRTTLDVPSSAREHVRRGAHVEIGSDTYTVDQPLADDGHMLRVVLR